MRKQRFFLSECCGRCRWRGSASFLLEWIRFDIQTRTRTSLCVLFSEETKTSMVFVTLSSSWSIITARVSHSARHRRCFSRVQALGCHVHFSQPLSSISWNRRFLSELTEKTLQASVNGCAWGLRDSQGSLLNQSWQILTTSLEVQRVLNHRSCDQRHKHGRLPDHCSASYLQFPQRWRSSFL